MAVKHFFHLISFLWLMEPLAATLAKPGCRDSCGNVAIPYPFGIGTGCFVDEWFEVFCHGNRSYLNKYYGHEFQVEVLYVSLGVDMSITINSNNSNISVCEDKSIWHAGNLSGSPFFYDLKKVILVGCVTVTLLEDARILGACTSTCGQSSIAYACDIGNNCFEISIPSTVQDFKLNFSYSDVTRTNSCASIIFGNPYLTNSYPSEIIRNSFPVQLRWSIPELMVPGLQNNSNCYKDPDYGEYRCSCGGYRAGNPYLPNGCQGHTNISMRRKPFSPSFSPSFSTSRKKLILLAVGETSFGILILGTVGFFSYKIISKRRKRKLREKFFKKNGGLLLQQQLSVDENMVDKVKFFTSNELDKATDNFNQNRVLGHGGQGTVYKGMLVDGKIVAIKKSKLAYKNQVEQFINEVVVLSQINHRNVVKLQGCCLETEVPLLVYEFIPNGTLHDLIHNEKDEILMSWDMRLRIATEVSGALAYLHSATSVPIYHRDIKSSNILLDEKHKAKVSDFGISRHVTTEQTHLTTMVKGTFGYLDPEYFQSNQFTEKSDVYSLGVVLIELLTRQKPISSTHSTVESGLSLATRFLISMEENHLNTILDAQILDTTNDKQVKAVAILAHRCLSLDGRKRPTMKEVALELESIKMSHPPSIVQKNLQRNKDTENELVLFSDGISSSTTANDTIASSSDVYPLLSDTF